MIKTLSSKTYQINTIILSFLAIILASCGLSPSPNDESTPARISRSTTIPNPTTPAPTSTLTSTNTSTPPPTNTPTPTETLFPTLTPTYSILRGTVLPDHLTCRYGPGAMYLYKYGLSAGNYLEILGRNELGTWVLIQAIGGNNPCWVNASMMELSGEVMALAPLDSHIVIPWSPFYTPLTGVEATRNGDLVTITWHPLVLRAGDSAEQIPYVIESWVCVNGDLIFTPIGAIYPQAIVEDQPGCDSPSHGQVSGAEKHGYTLWVEIEWPPHMQDQEP